MEFIIIRSLYGDTRRYYRNYISTLYLILVLQSLSLSYGSSTCTTEFILVFRIISWYYGACTCISDFIHVLQNLYMYFRSYMYITELILVLRNLYWYFGSYTCITELIHVFQILHVYYGTYTCLTELIFVYRTYSCLTDLILVLQNLFLYFGSYSFAKVPVGTMSRNRSESYHIQGRIRLIQIRTLVFRRYRSQIHYTEVPVGTTGLILILQDLYLFGSPVGVTEFLLI